MSTHRILMAAAEVIEANGLHKGDFVDYEAIERAHDEEGGAPLMAPVCAYGAINVAACGAPNRLSDAGDEAADVLAEHLGVEASISGIGAWNDAPERTAEQVAAALRAAAREVAA